LQHWAGVRLYTSFFNLAESCVFSKQSPPPLFCYIQLHYKIFSAVLITRKQIITLNYHYEAGKCRSLLARIPFCLHEP